MVGWPFLLAVLRKVRSPETPVIVLVITRGCPPVSLVEMALLLPVTVIGLVIVIKPMLAEVNSPPANVMGPGPRVDWPLNVTWPLLMVRPPLIELGVSRASVAELFMTMLPLPAKPPGPLKT